MATYRNAVIEWHDTPDVRYGVTVSVDEEWNGVDEEDDDIFYYFADEAEYERAKSQDNDFEFWIVEEDN